MRYPTLIVSSLAALLLASCQQGKSPTPQSPGEQGQDPRAEWLMEKASTFEQVKSCALKPDEAIARLTAKRDAMASTVQVGFDPEKIRRLAREGGCPGS